MTKYLRYALATFCFAVSVGGLALWWRSKSRPDELRQSIYDLSTQTIYLQSYDGVEVASLFGRSRRHPPQDGWYYKTFERDGHLREAFDRFDAALKEEGTFGTIAGGVYFPLWYPALIFALAGVGVLRCRRRFSIRSALICVSVVAALLGIVVAL